MRGGLANIASIPSAPSPGLDGTPVREARVKCIGRKDAPPVPGRPPAGRIQPGGTSAAAGQANCPLPGGAWFGRRRGFAIASVFPVASDCALPLTGGRVSRLPCLLPGMLCVAVQHPQAATIGPSPAGVDRVRRHAAARGSAPVPPVAPSSRRCDPAGGSRSGIPAGRVSRGKRVGRPARGMRL